MENVTNNLWYYPLIKGLIMIILALLIFLSPGGAILAWALYIGIGFILAGLLLISKGFSQRKSKSNWGWRVFEGIVDLLLGFILVANPLVTATILPFIFGFWGTVYGISLFLDSFDLQTGKGAQMFLGVILFLLSLIIMFNPFTAALSITVWLGVILLISGIWNVYMAFKIK